MTTVQPTADNPPSWREFADQLQPYMVVHFEKYERMILSNAHKAWPDEDPEEARRQCLQTLYEQARDQVRFAHVPLPPGVSSAELWSVDELGVGDRVVFGNRRSIDHLAVQIDGVQHADGWVMWSMYAYADGDPVIPRQARAFAKMLIEAAEELEAMCAIHSERSGHQ